MRFFVTIPIAIVLWCATCTAWDTDYNVPVFEIQDLISGVSDDKLKDILSSSGLISTRIPVSESDALRFQRGMSALCSCQTNLAHVRGGDRSTLSDGHTTRSSLATATMGMRSPLPLPSNELQSQCVNKVINEGSPWIQDLEWIRDSVSTAVDQAFVPALDRLLASSSDDSYLLKSQDGAQFFSIRSILQDSVHLEHFHVYSSTNTTRITTSQSNAGHMDLDDTRHVIDTALDFHTDAGLFLAFLPSMSCNPSNAATDDSFSIQLSEGNYRFVEKKVRFPSNSNGRELHIAIMLGEGAQYWLRTSHQNASLRATVHAVKMKKGTQRAWYGTMYLVPKNAIIQSEPVPYTFSDMKRSLATAHSAQRMFQNSNQGDQSHVVLGCGGNKKQTLLGQASTYRARLQMVNGPGDCSNTSNFYCWMSCQRLPDNILDIQDPSVQTHLQQGDSLYCLDEAVLSSSANLTKAVESCRDPISGVYGTLHDILDTNVTIILSHSYPVFSFFHLLGGAMVTSCKTQWHSTVSGVYPLLSNQSDSSSSIPASKKYCYGGTTMYMNGFVWEDTNCIIYLFEGWIISSRGLLALACIGTVLLGVALEAVVWIRRKHLSPKALLSKAQVSFIRKLFPTTFGYAIQLLFGYFLMLVVMTYSGPLVISVIGGLVLGNALFLWCDHRALRRREKLGSNDTLSLSLTEEDGCRGFTPCCDNGS